MMLTCSGCGRPHLHRAVCVKLRVAPSDPDDLMLPECLGRAYLIDLEQTCVASWEHAEFPAFSRQITAVWGSREDGEGERGWLPLDLLRVEGEG